MTETSAAVCFSTVSSVSSVSRSREICSSVFTFRRFSISRPKTTRFFRFVAKSSFDSGNIFGDDDNRGSFPWDSFDGNGAIQWVPEERITLFTADGLVQIGGSMVPKRMPSLDKRRRLKSFQRFQRFQESNYMDPKQGLCLGALFDIAATNGLDMGRKLCIYGFCRSIEMLSDVVEDTVLEHGGEIVAAEKASKGGMHEKLTMTVAVPQLWGVPPASETLHLAVRSGGGIVEKVYRQWEFL